MTLAATASDKSLDAFNKAVRKVAEIEICLMVAGAFDDLLTDRTRDISLFRLVLGDQINKLLGILWTNSVAVME